MNSSPQVYSYIRFSTPEQAQGSSGKRQSEYAAKYAREHGLSLDESLSMRDEGLSAYHQAHIKQGALGVFLRAVDDGHIAAGSVLIIEGLDRLSRAEPIQSQALLSQIINAGITVVTASDGKRYDRESLKANPMDLVYSLLVLIRAHEESDTKSKRVSSAIRIQCESWEAGRHEGYIRNGKDPFWVRAVEGEARYELIPERAEAVRFIVDHYMRGYGAVRIVELMRVQGLSYTGNPPNATQIYKLVGRKCLAGYKEIKVGGQEFELKGYYPAVLDAAEWAELQDCKSNRTTPKGVKQIPGVVSGIGITFCGYCGGSMSGINLMQRARKDGSLADGHRRLICNKHNTSRECLVGSSISVVPIERGIIEYCSGDIDLGGLVRRENSAGYVAKLAELKLEQAALSKKINMLVDVLVELDGEEPKSVMQRIRALEQEEQACKERIVATQNKISVLADSQRADLDVEWKSISGAAMQMDYDARMKVRDLVARTFTRIDVFTKGMGAHPSNAIDGKLAQLYSSLMKPGAKGSIDVLLHFNSGKTRMLRVHRRSEDWELVDQADFDRDEVSDALLSLKR